MNIAKIIAKNTLALTLGEVGNKAISFLFNIYLARILGATVFGEYHVVNAFIALFSFLPSLGTNLIVIREIAKDRKSQKYLVGQALVVNAFFSLVSFFLVIVLFGFYSLGQISILSVVFAAATLVVTSLRTVGILQFDGRERMGFSAFFSVVNNIFSVSGAMVGFMFFKTLSGLFAGVFVGSLFSTFIVWLVASVCFEKPVVSFDFQKIIGLLKLGLPLGVASLAAQIYSKIDTLMLGRFLSKESVAWYSAASILVFAGIQLMNAPLMAVIFPTLSRIQTKNRQFKTTIKFLLAIILGWSTIAIVVVQVMAGWVIEMLYGVSYAPAAVVLKTLIFIVPFISLSAFLYKILIIINKQTSYLKINITGALLSIIFNLIFIPQHGMIGAAYAAVLTHMAMFLIYSLTVRRHLFE